MLCTLPCDGPGICSGCRAGLPWTGPAYRLCGRPLADAIGVCGPCLGNPPVFGHTINPLQYQFPIRELVRQFKFQRNLAAGRALAALLADSVAGQKGPLPDGLVPVPLHRVRLCLRGFNQAYDLARHLGRQLSIPLIGHGLRRCRHTPSQAGLDATERRRNLRGAFAWRGPSPGGKHLVVVDDVMTTGATARECAKTLKNAGAARVDVWVVARAGDHR